MTTNVQKGPQMSKHKQKMQKKTQMLLSITFQEFAVQEHEYDGERGGGDDAGLGGRKIRDKGEFCS